MAARQTFAAPRQGGGSTSTGSSAGGARSKGANPVVATQELYTQLMNVVGQDTDIRHNLAEAIASTVGNAETNGNAVRSYQLALKQQFDNAKGIASQLAEMYITGAVEVSPAGWVVTTTYYAGEGEFGKAALSAAPAVVPLIGKAKADKVADVLDVAPPTRITGKALAQLRKDFNAIKPQAWMHEATTNAAKSTETQLIRMRKGLAPIGSDGFPMEIHHLKPLAEGGSNTIENFEFLTRTNHRLRDNYKRNHPNLP